MCDISVAEINELTDNFIENVQGFFNFLVEINDMLTKIRGNPPVPSMLLSLVSGGVNSLSRSMANPIMDTFALRAIPHYRQILDRDLNHFRSIAPSLFPEIPQNILNPIVDTLMGDNLNADTKSDIFDYIDLFVELAIQRQIALGKESKITYNDLLNAAGSFAQIPSRYLDLLKSRQ